MITFVAHCPYCMKEVGFESYGLKIRNKDEKLSAISLAAHCVKCRHSIVSDFSYSKENLSDVSKIGKFKDAYSSSHSNDLEEFFDISKLTFLPLPPSLEIPDDVPDPVKKSVRTAEKLYLQTKGDEDMLESAGTAYRKTLELALAKLDEGADKNLNQRINQLVKNGALVKSMGDFAHSIRVLGNDATHSDFSKDELEELRLFTQLFLQYTFTLPAKIPEKVKKL